MAATVDPAKFVALLDAMSQKAGTSNWSTAGRWVRAAGLILVTLALGLAIYFLIFSRGIIADAHRRNYHDLALAANGLETWPANIKQLARSNFAKGRLENATAAEQAAGWGYGVALDHPDIGPMRILYKVAAGTARAPTNCTSVATGLPAGSDNAHAFVPAMRAGIGETLVVTGELDLDQVWADDMTTAATADGSDRTAAVLDFNLPAEPARPAGNLVCYQSTVPLARLVAIDRSAKAISNLLIVSADGRIQAQVGEDPVPIRELGTLREAGFGLPELPKDAGTANKPIDLKDLRGPAGIDIGSESYIVYARPFTMPGYPTACLVPPPPLPPPLTTTANQKPEIDVEAARRCYAVALMPEAKVRERWLKPPPLVLAVTGLAILLALTTLPILRLALMGGNDALRGHEVAGVGAGLLIAAAMVTLSVLFAFDIARDRAAARDQASQVAQQIGLQAGEEVQQTLNYAATYVAGAAGRLAMFGPNPACSAIMPKFVPWR